MHAALLVHVVEVGLDAVAHLDAELRGRAGEHGRLAEQDPVRRRRRRSARRAAMATSDERAAANAKHSQHLVFIALTSRNCFVAESVPRRRVPSSACRRVIVVLRHAPNAGCLAGERLRARRHCAGRASYRPAAPPRAAEPLRHEQQAGTFRHRSSPRCPRRAKAAKSTDAVEVAAHVRHAPEPRARERHRR